MLSDSQIQDLHIPETCKLSMHFFPHMLSAKPNLLCNAFVCNAQARVDGSELSYSTVDMLLRLHSLGNDCVPFHVILPLL